jgi:hypothetical protein
MGGDYSFIDMGYDSMINKLFWIHNIKDVDSVRYELGTLRRTLSYDVTDDGFAGTVNGGPISEENGRRLYIRTLQTRVNSLLSADVQLGARYGMIAITLRDGTQHTLELYAVTGRVYGVVFNGADTRLTVHISTVDELIGCFETIDGGGTIPM